MKTATNFPLGVLAGLGLALAAGPAAAEKAVTLALADQVRVGYYWLYLPESLGYWKSEGVSVDVISVAGSVEALQQIVAGHAQFGQMGANNVVVANSREDIPVQVAMLNGVFQWKLGVTPGKGVASVEDLKGKSIGVYSLTTNGNLFLKPYLAEHGIDPAKDVDFVPVGYGGPALRALETGEVAALYYWPSAFVAYQNQGYTFDYFVSPEWSKYPDYSVAVHGSVVEKDPEMVVGVVRGMVKAAIFAEANPTCAVKVYWRDHPDGKPTDVSEDKAMADNLAVLQAQIDEYGHASEVFGKEMVGRVAPEAMGLLQDFLIASGQIEKATPPERMVVTIPDFFAKVNDFDKDAVRAAAKACAL